MDKWTQMDKQMDGRTDRWTYGWMDGQMDQHTDNQSPKGNKWSAIPVALLCMLVIEDDGKQGSGPKGDDVL